MMTTVHKIRINMMISFPERDRNYISGLQILFAIVKDDAVLEMVSETATFWRSKKEKKTSKTTPFSLFSRFDPGQTSAL